jgi:hypothetical protein
MPDASWTSWLWRQLLKQPDLRKRRKKRKKKRRRT